jgi:chemotaxis protein CheD
LELKENFVELLNYLRKNDISFSPEREDRIVKRLRLRMKQDGFKNSKQFLTALDDDSKIFEALIAWLERGKIFNDREGTFSPLILRENVTKNPHKMISKKNTNIISDGSQLSSNQEKTYQKASDVPDEKLLEFLRKQNIDFSIEKKTRLVKRLKIFARKNGYKDSSELLAVLKKNPEKFSMLLDWLKKGKIFTEETQSFSPLIHCDEIKADTYFPRRKSKRKERKQDRQKREEQKVYSEPPDTENYELMKNFLLNNISNFKDCKNNFLLTRLHSRMMRVDVTSYKNYVRMLETDPSELHRLAEFLSSNITYIDIGEIIMGYFGDLLKIIALGSCVGLVIYPVISNSLNRCAVMGHIMLPDSTQIRKTKKDILGPGKYADMAITNMIHLLNDAGYHKKTFEAKLVGGASMFGNTTITAQIGKRNVIVVEEHLKNEGIPLKKAYTGGDTGMSISFNISEYQLTVKPTGGYTIIV